MFDDYKKKVILAYQKKRDEIDISMNLLRPTPGKLKAECLRVYKERPLKKDENILRLFFGSTDDSKDYSQNIRKFEIDKFKPLLNFLKEKTDVRDENNIALLAWLIDFEPRPYQPGYKYNEDTIEEHSPENSDNSGKTEEQDSTISPVISSQEDDITDNGLTAEEVEKKEIFKEKIEEQEIKQKTRTYILDEGNKNPEEIRTITRTIQPLFEEAEKIGEPKKFLSKEKVKKTIAYFMLIIAVATSGSYLFVINNQECMYWTGDHYEPVSCNQKMGDTSVIAMDPIKVAQLRKITRPDTLTQNSLGKIWYVKVEGGVEFYTAKGFHPVYTDKRLRPVTPYILDKYVIQK